MNRWLFGVVLSCMAAALPQINAGTIVGSVKAQGKEGTSAGSGGGQYDSRKFKFVERIDYDSLRDFVVYVEGSTATNLPATAPVARVETLPVINQKGAAFSPHVLPIMAGTTVEWPNHDDIFHNVFSISETKPFDLGLYKDPEVKRVTFDKAGRVDAFCSIHKSMNCVVLVLENPYFAATDTRGRFNIRDVPAGTYRLRAWHERLPGQTKEIVVPATGEVRVDFTLGIKNLPQY